MDSLGIDNNTREIVWKITPQPKKNKPKAKATAPKSKPIAVTTDPDIKDLVDTQIKNLSSILFEKIQGLEQDVKKLRVKNLTLESRASFQDKVDTYTHDMIFQPWYL